MLSTEVLGQVILPGEASRTNLAVEQTFLGVCLQVSVVVAFVEELPAAGGANQRILREVPGAVDGHRVVALELLLADRARELLFGILVLLLVRNEAVFLEAREVAVGLGTLERLFSAVHCGHVVDPRRSMLEDFVA